MDDRAILYNLIRDLTWLRDKYASILAKLTKDEDEGASSAEDANERTITFGPAIRR